MKKPDSIARRLSHVSREERATKPIEIMEIVEGAQCTAAYIAQMRESLRTLRMERVFRVWLIFSRGLSSKPSFGRVNANECSGCMSTINFSHARADPVHDIASLARDAASPLAPNSRAGYRSPAPASAYPALFVAVLKMGSTTEMKKTIKSL